jgi:hypothetical protein
MILPIPLISVVAWLPGRFHPGHGLHSGPITHPWTTSKGRIQAVRWLLEPRLPLVPRFRQLLYRPQAPAGLAAVG